MNNFSEVRFKSWLKDNFNQKYFKNGNNIYKEEHFLGALSQFEVPPSRFLGNRTTEKLRSLLPILIKEKPRSVSPNIWLLYLFGFKKCTICKELISLELFSSNKSRWDNKSECCKICDNIRGKQYKDKNKEKIKETHNNWYRNNKHIRAAATAKRRATKHMATPLWLSQEQKEEIVRIYQRARIMSENGTIYHVDHIIPLQG